MFRAIAITTALANACKSLPGIHEELLLPAATLVVGLCYMSNALGNRPEESGDEFHVLRDTLSIHEDHGGRPIAIQPLNAFNLHSLRTEPCTRVSVHRCLLEHTLAQLCGIAGHDVTSRLLKLVRGSAGRSLSKPLLPVWGNIPQIPEDLPRRHVNRSHTVRLIADEVAPDVIPDDMLEIPDLPVPAAQGRAASLEVDFEEPAMLTGIRSQLNNIFGSMSGEIMLKVNNNTSPPFCWRRPDPEECHNLTFANTLCDSNSLPQLLVGWWQINDKEYWNKAVSRIFPNLQECSHLAQHAQNFSTLAFWQDWRTLLERLDPVAQQELVTAARGIVNDKVKWLPIGSARLWGGRPIKKPRYYFGREGAQPPGIALNPLFVLGLQFPGGRQNPTYNGTFREFVAH